MRPVAALAVVCGLAALCLAAWLPGAGRPAHAGTGPERSGKLVIAHRGASGYLPEHTLEAYALAYSMGADYIEPDVVMTRDGVLIALHDIHLERTTDVEQVFPQRARADGRWYAADFDLAEIKRLAVHERTRADGTAVFPDRAGHNRAGLRVPTLREVIELVQGLNATTGCEVGLYPETKEPAFHEAAGLSLEAPLLALLAEYGYTGRDAKVFVQSFDPESLKRLRALGTQLRLVQLIGGGRRSDALVTEQGLREIATYADVIGPAKQRVAAGADASGSPLVRRAHALGLAVHPWTFRADDLGEGFATLEAELRTYLEWGMDGAFTDHPDRLARLLSRARPACGRGPVSPE